MNRVFFEIPAGAQVGKADKKKRRVYVRAALTQVASNVVDNQDLREYNHPVFEYAGRYYPDYLNRSNAVKHILPIAEHFCKGSGLDIGGTTEWHFPGSKIVNPVENEYDAFNLPGTNYDYIFSSHCLEHIDDYAGALRIWRDALRPGGQLFLYLPHPDAVQWRPENCPGHYHAFRPEKIAWLLKSLGFVQVFYSNRDLFWSFSVTGVKPLENGLTR